MKNIISLMLIIFSCIACTEKKDVSINNENINNKISNKKEYNIIIVMDTIDDWSSGIRDGFKDTINTYLRNHGVKVNYFVYDTELKPEKAKEIVKKIKLKEPDLICTINYPTVFADEMISKKLIDKKYKIVSENCIPVKSGTIDSWEKPGGNITGVGVFIQKNSPIRLMKKLNPKMKRLAFYSWDKVKILNEWFEQEIKRACKEEGIELIEFRKVPHREATIEFFKEVNNMGSDVFMMGGISAFVNKDGSPANDKQEVEWLKKYGKFPFISYEETTVQYGNIAGTCVVWYDIGVQLAEKGILILNGENPGDISWDYPRKYNIILNKKRAKKLNIDFPQNIISAAYRIYTDYKGNFIGQEK